MSIKRFRENPLGILSPGQSSQQAGMGELAYGASHKAEKIFNIASEVTGVDMAEVCFGSQTEKLEDPLIAQPAIATVNIADAQHLKERGIRFDVGIGHSVGEVPLLAIAGILPVRQTIELVKIRAEVTARASVERPGIMAAVSGLKKEEIQKRAAHILENARVFMVNFNGTHQQVFSGDQEPMEELEELIRNMRVTERLKVAFTKLRTGGAFHSPYHMENAEGEFKKALSRVSYSAPEFELMLNNGMYLSELGTSSLPWYLSAQLVSPVDFVGGPEKLVSGGVSNYVEVGKKAPNAKYKTLSGLLKREFGDRVHIIEVIESSNGEKRSNT